MHPQRNENVTSRGPLAAGSYGASETRTRDSSSGVTASNSLEISALEGIAGRLQFLAQRLDDTNRHTLAFIERIVGPEPTKPEPAPMTDGLGDRMPALAVITTLLDRIECHTHNADSLSHKLTRIG